AGHAFDFDFLAECRERTDRGERIDRDDSALDRVLLQGRAQIDRVLAELARNRLRELVSKGYSTAPHDAPIDVFDFDRDLLDSALERCRKHFSLASSIVASAVPSPLQLRACPTSPC